jgi:DNA-binding IclR family transcriptional regulator
MKLFNEATKTYKLFKALHAGEVIDQFQATWRWDIKNLPAEVSRIRAKGYAVYCKDGDYNIGKASRALVAAGYRALAMGI